jgi:hypothetical protein
LKFSKYSYKKIFQDQARKDKLAWLLQWYSYHCN